MYRLITSLALSVLLLGGCALNPEWEELKAGYSDDPEATADFKAFDAAAMYEPVQIAILAAVQDPNVPDDIKTSLKLVDQEAVAGLETYRTALATNPAGLGPALDTMRVAINRALVLLAQYAAEQSAAVGGRPAFLVGPVALQPGDSA